MVERFAIEAALGRHHGVRLEAPLPAGVRTLDVMARSGETLPFLLLSERSVIVPPLVTQWDAERSDDFPAGTPMPHVLDQDGNGSPEVFVETPPNGNTYGFVNEYEVTGPGTVVERGSSEPLFRGIPVDAADIDQDGNLELVVFRLDGWGIWEASTPSGFPDQLLHQETGSRPVRFLDLSGVSGLLVVSGSSLRFVNLDGSVILQASSGGPDLEAQAAIGDFDQDGKNEIAVANQDGDVAFFELSGTTLSFDTMLHPPVPVEPALAAVPDVLQGQDLVTVERDPPFPNQEGDLDRAATRLRRWRWDGAAYQSISTLAFSGKISPGRIQLLANGSDLWLRRDRWVDLVRAEPWVYPETTLGLLLWYGRIYASALSRVDGFALVPARGVTRQWIGTSAGPPSEDLVLHGHSPSRPAESPEVLSAGAGVQGLDVVLGWNPNLCASSFVVRNGNVRGTYALTVNGDRANDTIAMGESVRYTLSGPLCVPRSRDVLGRPIEPLVPRWEKSEIALDFQTPLRPGPLPEVLLRIGNRLEPPRAVHVYKEGKELLVVPGKEPPDSVIVIGAWQTDGLPLGGSVRSAAAVPPYPGEVSPTVLADVRYDAALHLLHVTLGGDSLACDPTFVLEPEDRSFPETARSGSLDLHLDSALASGVHTLQLQGACVDEQGSARSFRVGRAMYPNPVKNGQEFVVEGLEAGSRVAFFDVNGQERLSWQATGVEQRGLLDALAPGLYFVRFESAEGKTLAIEKLAVIR